MNSYRYTRAHVILILCEISDFKYLIMILNI